MFESTHLNNQLNLKLADLREGSAIEIDLLKTNHSQSLQEMQHDHKQTVKLLQSEMNSRDVKSAASLSKLSITLNRTQLELQGGEDLMKKLTQELEELKQHQTEYTEQVPKTTVSESVPRESATAASGEIEEHKEERNRAKHNKEAIKKFASEGLLVESRELALERELSNLKLVLRNEQDFIESLKKE